MNRPWLVPLLSGLLAVVLVTGLVGVVTHNDPAPKLATAPTTAPPPTSQPPGTTATTVAPAAGSVDAFIPVAEKFVEQHRGLKFKAPVKVTVLDDAAFRQRLLGDQQSDKDELDRTSKVMRALGLIPPNIDLGKTEDSLLGTAVAGFYDPKTKALVVRGVKATPYVRQVIVHELTHALQDQVFDVDRPELDKANDERPDGFRGLVEGDAVRIDGQYRASLSASDQRQAAKEESSQAGGIDPTVPQALLVLLGFPYDVGPPFTEALLKAGGQAKLDAAFTNPPTTTEELIHPEKYLAGEGAKPVSTPPADGKQIDSGVLGELGLTVVLGQAEQNGDIGAGEVDVARQGWGGDEYVAWDQGGETCVRDRIVMDTSADTQELLNALRRIAGKRKGLTVSGTGGTAPITLTSCG